MVIIYFNWHVEQSENHIVMFRICWVGEMDQPEVHSIVQELR